MISSPWILYGICALMLLAAVAALLPTLLARRPESDAADAEALAEKARSLAMEALAAERSRLDAERASGRIDEKEYEALLADLRRRALEEHADPADPGSGESAAEGARRAAPKPLALSRASLAALVTAAMTFVAVGSYAFLGSPEMPELQNAQKVMEGNASAEAIESYLATAPKDGRAWVLFAHRKIEAGDFRSAARALRTAREVEPKIARDTDVMLEYGAAVLTAKEAELYSDAHRVLKEAYGLMPDDQRAERLTVMAAIAAGDWAWARDVVRAMLAKMPPDSPDYLQAEQTLRQLESRAASGS